MTTEEFSNEFDILYNNISSNQAPGLNEYEKSEFLTKAQEEIIVGFYSGKNPFRESFEKTEEIRRYLDALLVNEELKPAIVAEGPDNKRYTLTDKSWLFNKPEDLWFITYESIDLKDGESGCPDSKGILVIPIKQDDLIKVLRNPFRRPSKNKVLRVESSKNYIELITDYPISKYLISYIKKPQPIILSNIQDEYGVKINEVGVITECELHPAVHRAILDRAVNIAIRSMSTRVG